MSILISVWQWLSLFLLCRIFGRHNAGVALTKYTNHAEIVSDSSPTMIYRFRKAHTHWRCTRCQMPFYACKEISIPHSEPSPRAPGENGAKIGAIKLTQIAKEK